MKNPTTSLIRKAPMIVGLVCSFSPGAVSQAASPVPSQIVIGQGNARAIAISKASPLIDSANEYIRREILSLKDPQLRAESFDAIMNPKTLIKHRINVTETKKQEILKKLIAAGLVDPSLNETFPGGIEAGVFPPIVNDGTATPQLPQRFSSSPGSVWNGHQAEPGGLVIHEAFNSTSGQGIANAYHFVYGHLNGNGLPSPTGLPDSNALNNPVSTRVLPIDRDIIVGAPLWHDWAKSMVFQWNADGTEFQELSLGGNGKTDDFGHPGSSETGAHHILSIAESMARHLPAAFVIAQASCHSAPTEGSEYKVVNWLHAAAIIAQIDPVASGYLSRDSQNNLRLPPVRHLADGINLNDDPSRDDPNVPGRTNFLVEDTLMNLSDADWIFTEPSTWTSNIILAKLAPKYGYDAVGDPSRYNNYFRNVALSYLSAERLQILYANRGLSAVVEALDNLRRLRIL